MLEMNLAFSGISNNQRQRINVISVGQQEETLTVLRRRELQRLFAATTFPIRCDGLAPIFTSVDVMPPVDRCSNSRLVVPFAVSIFGDFGEDPSMSH